MAVSQTGQKEVQYRLYMSMQIVHGRHCLLGKAAQIKAVSRSNLIKPGDI